MSKVNLTIDGKAVSVESDMTVLHAAKQVGIDIPTLCYLDLHNTSMQNKTASCRVCVVEIEGRRNLAPACATPVVEGMVVKTNSMRVLNARKTNVELLISDHPNDCLTCIKSGECELQSVAKRVGVTKINVTGKSQSTYEKSESVSIVRDMNKCIMCRRCETMCNSVQSVGALSGVNRGFTAFVGTAFDENLENTVCIHCGQCVAVCPVGALSERDNTLDVMRAIADPDTVVVVQTAPATRVAIGEEFGMEPGSIATNKMVAALKQLGADYVFDTNFSADLTIMEEGTEVISRLEKFIAGEADHNIPIFTSCCPGWANYYESRYHEMLHLPSTARSPQGMFGSVAKTYFAEKLNIPREKMVVVSIMPCIAKKHEAAREELKVGENADTDIVLTTRELARLIKNANIEFTGLEDQEYDAPMGLASGAGAIFGASGGVLEAALRTVYEIMEGKELEKVDFESVRGLDGIKIATVEIKGIKVNVAAVSGLANARTIMDEVKAGNPRNLHIVEVMACPGGCIGGGGQPFLFGRGDILEKRTKAIYQVDSNSTYRKSHENPAIKELYDTYLGKPNGEKAHHLLHTSFTARMKI